ncbi:MAG: AraC family transcriptional regulator [Bacteroidales bacterium]|nr:AraC family transcriptional regulator [Bacteroidales bacterium]
MIRIKNVMILLILLGNCGHGFAFQDTIVALQKQAILHAEQRNYQQAFENLKIVDSLLLNQIQQDSIIIAELSKKVKLTSQNQELLDKKVRNGLILFILLDVLGMFMFLYLEKQRAYLKLVRKNVEWAQPQNSATQLMDEEKDAYSETFNIDKKDKELFLQCLSLFQNDKIYLNPDITVQDIAKTLNCNKNNLSKIVNTCSRKTFPALLNEYRVKEAIRLLTDEKKSAYKLEVIGEMSGYKNRQVFHCAFKKETGVTPNDFRKISFSTDFVED